MQIHYIHCYPVVSGTDEKIHYPQLPAASVFPEEPCCRLFVIGAHTDGIFPLLHGPFQQHTLLPEYHTEF